LWLRWSESDIYFVYSLVDKEYRFLDKWYVVDTEY